MLLNAKLRTSLFNPQSLIFLLTLVSIYSLAWMMQARLFINWDVSALLQITKKMLEGGKYGQDFFEVNPPLILYLYAPPWIISHIFSWDIGIVLRSYVFFLATASLILCYFFLCSILRGKNTFIYLFFSVLALAFLVLPIENFAQREHLLIILTMPYFLLIVCRVQGNIFSKKMSTAIGLIAALGFSMKPFFLIAPLLLEIYYGIIQRRFFSWARSEVIALILFLIAYLIFIFVWHDGYISVVLPVASNIYYLSVKTPLNETLGNHLVIYCYLAGLFYCLQKWPCPPLSTVLCLLLVGSLVSYLLQNAAWFFHLIPALSAAWLLTILIFWEFLTRDRLTVRDYVLLSFFGVLFFLFQFHYNHLIWTVGIFDQYFELSFFAGLLAVLLYQAQAVKSTIKVIGSVFIILFIIFLFSSMARYTTWGIHYFLLSNILLILLFGLLVSKDKQSQTRSLFFICFAMIIFSYPVYAVRIIFKSSEKLVQQSQQVDQFMIEHAVHKRVYVFSGNILVRASCLRFVDACSLPWVHLKLFSGLLRATSSQHDKKQLQQLEQDRRFLIERFASDFDQDRPNMVLIDNILIGDVASRKVDYITYFSQSMRFREVWRHYHYMATLQNKNQFLGMPYNIVVYQYQESRKGDNE